MLAVTHYTNDCCGFKQIIPVLLDFCAAVQHLAIGDLYLKIIIAY